MAGPMLRLALTLLAAAPLALTAGAAEPAASRAAGAAEATSIALDPRVPESSGLAASLRHPGVLWTHGDSGNSPTLFAVDAATGRVIRSFDVAAKNVDWEDVALAPGPAGTDLLYVADVGNNAHNRATLEVIVLDEPDPRAAGDAEHAKLRPSRVLKLRYPPGSRQFDVESLFVWKDRGYLIEKNLLGGRADVFSFKLAPDKPFQALEPAGALPVRLPVTGADLSRDGRTLALATVAGPRVLDLRAAPQDPQDWSKATERSATYLDPHLESAALVPGGVAMTTESGRLLFFPWPALR